jgi:hypothetical protein
MKIKPTFSFHKDPNKDHPGYIVEVFVNGRAYQRLEPTKVKARRRILACKQVLRLPDPPGKALKEMARMQRATGADHRAP